MPRQSTNIQPTAANPATQTPESRGEQGSEQATTTTRRKKRSQTRKSPEASEAPIAYASDLAATLAVNTNGEAQLQENAEQLAPKLAQAKAPSIGLSGARKNLPMEERPGEVLRLSEEAFAKTGSWVMFYREMLAPGGIVDQLYDTPDQRRYFETTESLPNCWRS